jgi:hypothetical protein
MRIHPDAMAVEKSPKRRSQGLVFESGGAMMSARLQSVRAGAERA